MSSSIQSFVIRIWVEETAEESGETVWRGHITHVESRNRVYFTELEQIAETVAAYLEAVNIPARRRGEEWTQDAVEKDVCPKE